MTNTWRGMAWRADGAGAVDDGSDVDEDTKFEARDLVEQGKRHAADGEAEVTP